MAWDIGRYGKDVTNQISRTARPRRDMTGEFLNANEAARRLGVSRASLYGWLAQSDAGTFVIRGRPVTIDYFQGGARGQGRIQIEASEIERLRELMRVRPLPARRRRSPTRPTSYPGITVKLGVPGD